MGIDNSYLQSGHTVLLALVLVCAFIDLPGFPLTSLPFDVREFLKVRVPLLARNVSHVLDTACLGRGESLLVVASCVEFGANMGTVGWCCVCFFDDNIRGVIRVEKGYVGA